MTALSHRISAHLRAAGPHSVRELRDAFGVQGRDVRAALASLLSEGLVRAPVPPSARWASTAPDAHAGRPEPHERRRATPVERPSTRIPALHEFPPDVQEALESAREAMSPRPRRQRQPDIGGLEHARRRAARGASA